MQTKLLQKKARNISRTQQLLWLLIACLSITSCGFALRGSATISADVQPIYVIGRKESQELAQAVRRQLEINQLDVTTKRRDAKTIVELELLTQEKRSIALDSEARDAEYALFERAQLSLHDTDGRLLRGPRILEQRRLIVNDTDNPVGEETESSIVRNEMRKRLSIQMARQLEYWLKQVPAAGQQAAQ